MYWPRKENIQSTANVQNDEHTNFGEKNFREHFKKKISLKLEKEKKQKYPKQKRIVELFTVSLKILSSGCARQ